MEVKEDVFKDVQEIFGRIIFWKNFWNKNLRLAYHLCPNIFDFFFLKKNTQIFMGNFFLYKVPCFVKNLNGKNHTYYYTFPRFNLAKRVNPPITKIGHVLKNVFFFSLIFQLNTKMSESCFVSILWRFSLFVQLLML